MIEAVVPCAGCTACCRNELVVLVEEDGDPAQWDTVPLEVETALGFDDQMRRLRTTEDGACVYLGALGCSIHQRRPAMCRAFDCRKAAMMLGLDVALALVEQGDPVMRAALDRLGK